MTGYLSSERIKIKHSFSSKLIFVAPITTALLGYLMGGLLNFQPLVVYWWYAFLLPGTAALLCALSNQKEERAAHYFSVLSQPLNLCRFWYAKISVIAFLLFLSGIVLALFVSITNVIAPSVAYFSPARLLAGMLSIALTSLWQVPLCLFLARKLGFWMPILLNALLGVFAPILLAGKAFWWLCPYCWTARLLQEVLGIQINGVLAPGTAADLSVVLLAISLSIAFFAALSFLTAQWFSRQEAK